MAPHLVERLERLQRHKDTLILSLTVTHTRTHTANTCITGDGLVECEVVGQFLASNVPSTATGHLRLR